MTPSKAPTRPTKRSQPIMIEGVSRAASADGAPLKAPRRPTRRKPLEIVGRKQLRELYPGTGIRTTPCEIVALVLALYRKSGGMLTPLYLGGKRRKANQRRIDLLLSYCCLALHRCWSVRGHGFFQLACNRFAAELTAQTGECVNGGQVARFRKDATRKDGGFLDEVSRKTFNANGKPFEAERRHGRQKSGMHREPPSRFRLSDTFVKAQCQPGKCQIYEVGRVLWIARLLENGEATIDEAIAAL